MVQSKPPASKSVKCEKRGRSEDENDDEDGDDDEVKAARL